MLYLLDPDNPKQGFPDPARAERYPDGLLAVGGDLSPQRLLDAYRNGIFPWFNQGQPILWWSPDPRLVLFPERVRISRSLKKTLRKGVFSVSFDQAFEAVIRACAGPRPDAAGTWILDEMIEAYLRLHRLGHAHSVEVWKDDRLAGGLYGVSIGTAFFGESMFSRENDASKVALVSLCTRLAAWRFEVIDCQLYSEHLVRLGAEEIAREEFLRLLQHACAQDPEHDWPAPPGPFTPLEVAP
ncbi:MAG: leucyl/phenylalanyl-tRNA--protein transferase [Pseudomonadota bacterium]